MADPKLLETIRNTQQAPALPGGETRVSQTVNLAKYPAIQQRQDLNRRLLEHTCANEDKGGLRLEPNDLPVLLQMARERGAHTGNLLRRHAIQALGNFQTLEVANVLTEIAGSAVEHDSLRIQALSTLSRVAPGPATGVLLKHLSDSSAIVRQAAAKSLAEVGDAHVVTQLAAVAKSDKHPGVQQQAAAALQAIGGRLRIDVPKFKVPAPPKKAATPTEDK